METFAFRAHLGEVSAARRRVVGWARRHGCPDRSLRTIALLTSELLVNAVRHGPGDGTVTVTAEVRDAAVRVAVRDESPHPPRLLRVGPEAESGRGVMLVDRLASRWGVEGLGGKGKTVWFEVQRPRRGG